MDRAQIVADELQKTIKWLLESGADNKKLAAHVLHALQLTLERMAGEEVADRFWEGLAEELAKR